MRTRSPLPSLPLARLLAPLALLAHASVGRAAPPPAPPPAGVVEAVDEQAEFEKGRNAYRAQKYEEADARFLRMLDPEHGSLHDKVLIKQARMYWAATRVALHQDEDARGQFEILLNEDPHYEPDPLAFPTDVVNAFIDTRARLHARLEEIQREQYRRAAERKAREEVAHQREVARLKMLEKLAGEAEVTEKHSRWIALLPFGAGQFQNGQRTLGWFFVATESTLVAGGLVTVPIYWADLAKANQTYSLPTAPIAQQYLDRANTVQYINLALYGALAATVIAGAIQAEVAYVPDPVSIRPRAVPELPAAPPPAAPPSPLSFGGGPLPGRDGHGVGGASLGATFRF